MCGRYSRVGVRYLFYEKNHNDNDDDDEGDVFAYGPPLTSEHPPQPHQHQHQHQQDMSPHQHLSAAQLHNLAAASLSISTDAPPPSPPPSGLSSIRESTTAPNSGFSHAHDHHHDDHHHSLETSSFNEYEPGPKSYSMRLTSVRPGILIPQRTNPTLGPLSYAHITAREYLQVVLPPPPTLITHLCCPQPNSSVYPPIPTPPPSS